MTNFLTISEPGEVLMAIAAMGHDPRAKRNALGMDFTKSQRVETYDFINPSQHNLVGRSVFITGASKGLGAAYAISYAKAGVNEIGLGARSNLDVVEQQIISAAKEAGYPPPHVLKIKIDIANNNEVLQAAQTVKQAVTGLDILINNAGAIEAATILSEVEISDWWRTFEVNTLGTFQVTRAFLPFLLAHPHRLKTCIMIGSAWGLTTFPENSAYQITKLAQLRLADMVNVNYPPSQPASTPGGSDDGLLCYTVHPGGVKTGVAMTLSEKVHPLLVSSAELAADGLVWLTSGRREWLRGRFVSCMWDFKEFVNMKEEIVREDLLKVRMSVGGE